MSCKWQRARARIERAAILELDEHTSIEVRRTQGGKYVKLTVCGAKSNHVSVLLDYHDWEAFGQLRYEVSPDDPTETEKAVDNILEE